MTAPPFEDTLNDGMAALRDALSHAPEAAREEVKQVLDSDELVKRVVNIVVPVMDDRFRRKYYRNMIAGVGILLAIFSVAFLVVFSQLSGQAATNTNQDAAIQRSQDTITAFRDQLDTANTKLISQGLAPISAPQNPAPGTVGQAQLINAAATASTLAALPRQTVVSGTAVDLAGAAARAVADYFSANPTSPGGPNPQQVIDGLATYFKANPVQQGPQGIPGIPGTDGLNGSNGSNGAQGEPGPAPTSDQIRSAFREEVAANPQILCPLGGVYDSRSVALANGGQVTQFSCFTGDQAPPTTDPSLPPVNGGNGAVQPTQNQDPPVGPQTPGSDTTPSSVPTATPEASPDLLGDLMGVTTPTP